MTSSFFRTTIVSSGAASVLYGCYVGYNQFKVQHPEFNNKMLKRLNHVHDAFANSKPLKSEEDAKGVFGRVKCMVSGELTTLSNPIKPFTWVMGPEGLYNLSQQKTDYDKLMELGFESTWIEKKLANGQKFNFYFFPEHSDKYKATQATWDGIFELLDRNDTEIYERIKGFREEIQATPFDEIESCADFNFLETELEGPKNPKYMTRERFLQIDKDKIRLCDVRFLFYCYLGLSKYYIGDGYTRTKNGERGSKEYLMKNTMLNEIEHLKMVPLNVEIPPVQE